jgi:hypothetical protein
VPAVTDSQSAANVALYNTEPHPKPGRDSTPTRTAPAVSRRPADSVAPPSNRPPSDARHLRDARSPTGPYSTPQRAISDSSAPDPTRRFAGARVHASGPMRGADFAAALAQAAPTQAAVVAEDPHAGWPEVEALLNQYDGGEHHRNYEADLAITGQLAAYSARAMTGRPSYYVETTQAIVKLAAATAQMDEEQREAFTGRGLAVLGLAPAKQRAALQSLERDIAQERAGINENPIRRLKAIFAAPPGIEQLKGAGSAQMKALLGQFDALVAPGTDAAAREQALVRAVAIKRTMQAQIASVMKDSNAREARLWNESAQRVDKILDEAGKYNAENIHLPHNSDDPQWDETRRAAYAKTFAYQSIGEKLLSDDSLSQQERDNPAARPSAQKRQRSPDEIERDLLTFQKGMLDSSSSIFRRDHALETRAAKALTGNGDYSNLTVVGRPQIYWDTDFLLPKPDANYAYNLSQHYIDVNRDLDLKSRQMIRSPLPDDWDKVRYAFGKALNSVMPPGIQEFADALLDEEVPNHGGLSPKAETALNTVLWIGGILMGGRKKWSEIDESFGINQELANDSAHRGARPASTPRTGVDPLHDESPPPSLGSGSDATLAAVFTHHARGHAAGAGGESEPSLEHKA